MPILPPITDLNTFADKTSGGNPAVVTDVGRAVDLNALKARVAENRAQANLAAAPPVITITDADSPFTLLPSHAGHIIRIDASAGAVSVVAPSSLYDATNSRAFSCWFDVVDIASGISLSGAGGLDVDGSVTAAGLYHFAVTDPLRAVLSGSGGGGQDFAPAPAVHTGATRTLTDADRNSVIRVSGASNPVTIRIPDTLTGGSPSES
jgi:hypothetical protein